jgi:hypothetical protein
MGWTLINVLYALDTTISIQILHVTFSVKVNVYIKEPCVYEVGLEEKQ